jgi:transcriptional regulator GlxA family with amidase domain
VRVDIAVFDGFDELDVIGPLETLRAAGGAHFDVRLVTCDGQATIRGAHGVAIGSDQRSEPGADLLLLPGGGWVGRAERGAWAEARSGRWTPIIRGAAEAGALLAGVCTGTMLLATAGVVAGRRATTHHDAWPELEAAGAALVRERVVDDGDLVTSGGVTSGIDLGLWLVERFAGAALADRVADGLEYRRERPSRIRSAAVAPSPDR